MVKKKKEKKRKRKKEPIFWYSQWKGHFLWYKFQCIPSPMPLILIGKPKFLWTRNVFKACVHHFLFHLKRFLRSHYIQFFVYPSPLIFLLSVIAREVYDVINWLNKNLKTHIVWYIEKEIRSDIATWSIDKI